MLSCALIAHGAVRPHPPSVLSAADVEPITPAPVVAECAGRWLLVVPPPEEPSKGPANTTDPDPQNGPDPFGPNASAAVPCLGTECAAYAQRCAASSWTSRFLQASLHATKAAAAARLLRGLNPHPCVTYDPAHPNITAVALAQGLVDVDDSGPTWLPIARRFLYGARVSMKAFYQGTDSDLSQSSDVDVRHLTAINRGIFVRPYAGHPWPLQLRDGGLEYVYGWPIGMDSAFTPATEECLTGWQHVLRSKALPLLADEARATADHPPDPRTFIAATAGNGSSHGLAICTRDMLQLAAATLPARLCTSEPGAIRNATGDDGVGCGYNASGPIDCGPPNKPPSMVGYASLFFGATFALLPAGDALDRDEAMLQALEGGAIPVFFGGNSRGDLTRGSYTRTLMNTPDPDRWSVLIDDAAAAEVGAVELRKVLSFNETEANLDSVDVMGNPQFHTVGSECKPMNATRAGEELVNVLATVPLERILAMKEFIVDRLPARTSMLQQRSAGLDFVDRLVLAMLSANTSAPSMPNNWTGGSLLTWPLGV